MALMPAGPCRAPSKEGLLFWAARGGNQAAAPASQDTQRKEASLLSLGKRFWVSLLSHL